MTRSISGCRSRLELALFALAVLVLLAGIARPYAGRAP